MLSCHFSLRQLRCTWSVFSAWTFPVLAGSALLSELNLLFNSTYVLWAWESAPLLEAKQSPLMIFHSLMLSEKAECAQWQSRDQKTQSRVSSRSYVCLCLHFFTLLLRCFLLQDVVVMQFSACDFLQQTKGLFEVTILWQGRWGES